eukprot:CAMPEP_0172667164 /NCGR_PEP_ID=MMETSP1074-20121228/8252_1 /TAXON_ID=2916 /ORGANISM="Ceratium fusus, Strain PA161109" /LENGTH=228 /DNA_ID=CAMNT_0013483631 /DNA_START=209 /DNA_END=895 /DNA_ORIENTATION=-
MLSSRKAGSLVHGVVHMDCWHVARSRVPMQSMLDDIQMEEGQCLKVSAYTKAGKLGRVLSTCAKNGSLGTVYAQSTGSSASSTSLTSVVFANMDLSNEKDSSEALPEQLVVLPSQVDMDYNGSKRFARRLHFQLEAARSVPTEAEEDALMVGGRTDSRKLSRAVLKCIEKHGEAVMKAIGDQAVSSALLAAIFAKSETKRLNGTLALLPSFYDVNETKKGMQIRCFTI